MKCKTCPSKCCRYIALYIDPPKHKADFEHIRWYLTHKGVSVFIEKRKWYLEIQNICTHLTKDNRCDIYETRPLICREHSTVDCENSSDDFNHSHIFHDIHSFDKYLNTRFAKKRKPK